jgi:orotate phosphoribosyltransferase
MPPWPSSVVSKGKVKDLDKKGNRGQAVRAEGRVLLLDDLLTY